MKSGRFGSLILILILLVGFNVNLIGADGNESIGVDAGEVAANESVGEILVANESTEVVLVNDSGVVGNVSVDLVNNTKDFIENTSEIADSYNNTIEFDCFDGAACVDLDDLIEGEVEEVEDDESVVVTQKSFSDGRVELEFESASDDVKILKKEMGMGDYEKRVRISSEEHFDDEVVVYSDLPSEAKKEDIVIIWENENEIVTDIRYFDKDGNDLIERVSWVVPHLSVQNYRIEIIVDGAGTGSNEIVLSIDAPVNGSVVGNPVEFNVSIEYFNLSEVSCLLEVDSDGNGYSFFGDIGDDYGRNFSEGSHDWEVYCWDINDSSINVMRSGNFVVSVDLTVSGFYFENDIVGSVNANSGGVELFVVDSSGAETSVKNLTGSYPQPFEVDFEDFDGDDYSLKAVSFNAETPGETLKTFSLGRVEVDFDSSVVEDEDVDFDIDMVNTPHADYELYVGGNKRGIGINDEIITGSFDEGVYAVQLRSIHIRGNDYPTLNFGNLVVTEDDDNEIPKVDVIYPGWEEEISDDEVTFRYEVNDDGAIERCEFSLYNASETSSGGYEVGDIIYPLNDAAKALAHEYSVVKNSEIEVELVDFDEGGYMWEIKCFDEAGDEGSNFNYFSVDFGGNGSVALDDNGEDYDRKDEVMDLIDDINEFLEKESGFGVEELNALDVLGFSSSMGNYKKKLVQFDQDLKFNLRFMEVEKRAKRITEIDDEIDEMKENIILDIEVTDSYEYSKSSLDVFMIDVLEAYMDASGTNIGTGALRSLAAYNEKIQNKLTSKIEVFKINLKYLDGSKNIVLVSKSLDVDGDEDIILEVLPEDIAEDVVFIGSYDEIDSEIYKIDISDLDDDKLVYYFEDDFDLEDIEETETILFDEGGESGKGVSLTGYFVGIGDDISLGSLFFLVMFMFVGFIGFFLFGKIKVETLKKDPNSNMVLDLIGQTRVLIRENRIDNARDNYHEMGRVYRLLSGKSKEYFYKEIQKIHLAINKKDVLNLLREYEKAKGEFRKDDAIELHKKINDIYKKLPKKFQDKVYQRLVKREF